MGEDVKNVLKGDTDVKNIIFIGMTCSGKTTVGKKVAEELGKRFMDTDDLIESNENTTIKEIFLSKGEQYFRQLENNLLDKLLDTHCLSNSVISVGGGLPILNNNMEKLKRLGITVFLDVPIELLIERLKNSYERVVTANGDRHKLKKLYKSRIYTYMQADLRIKVGRMDLEKTSKKIISLINKI